MFPVLGDKIKEQREEIAPSHLTERNTGNSVKEQQTHWSKSCNPDQRKFVIKCYDIHSSAKYHDVAHSGFRIYGKQ